MTGGDEYLSAVESEDPPLATAEVMDRLAERLKSTDSTAQSLKEMKAAGEAVAALAQKAENPSAVVNQARNSAGEVAQSASQKKSSIIEQIESETDEVLKQGSDDDVRLENLYGFDRYLEDDLEEIEIVRSTDRVTDPLYRWKFSDGARIEHDDSVHMDRYNFWQVVVQGSKKRLTHELASDQVGDPDENEKRYRQVSLGPESRPWHATRWVECIQDLITDRATEVETVGPRSSVWEEVQDWIRHTRAVADRGDAIVDSQAHVVEEDDEIVEVWVPASVINKKCEEWGVAPNSLQVELSERGVDSDEVSGNGLSDAFMHDGRATRYWRLDATHDEVPPPDEIVQELDDGLDRGSPGHGFSYGGGDGE